MRKIWLIARQTYKRRIHSANFLLLTFGLPILMIVAGAIPIILGTRAPLSPIGLVDETGTARRSLTPPAQVTAGDDTVQVQTFASTDAAQAAYRRGEIDGFLVVPAGYLAGEPVVFYGDESPNATTEEALADLMRQSLRPGEPPWLYMRLADPSQVVYEALDSGQQIVEGLGLAVHVALPAALGVLFGLAVFMASLQMGAAVVREKDQRSIEMVITSLRIRELVTGKVLGITLLSLTQFAFWGVGAVVGVGLALSSAGALQDIVIPWGAVAWAMLLGVPGYVLYGTLAAGLGVIAGDHQQARQLAGILGFVALAPLWFTSTLLGAPNGPVAVAATLFPLTSPMFSLLRMAFTEVPAWQLAAGFGLTLAGLAAALWFVARIFRAAMLVYGKSLRAQEILRALRQA